MIKADYQTPRPSRPAGRQRGAGQGGRRVERRLAAVMAADIAGYSAMMGGNEEETHRRVGEGFDRVFKEIEKYRGRVFTFAGDGIMAEFPSAVEALKCALRVQVEIARRNGKRPLDKRIQYRIGINSGEIMIQDDRTGGTALNIAARLEQIAEPGGICLSSVVFDQVKRVVAADYAPMGEQRLKNIRDPVAAYRISAEYCRSWRGMPTLPRETPPASAAEVADYRPSLAVLPFRTLQKDQSDAYFAEGMIDDIINALSGVKDMLVIARSSTQTFAGAPLDLRRVGQELDVRYVLPGSVRRSEDKLRIGVELSEAQTGQVIWTSRFDGELSDIFQLQDRIAIRVATTIVPELRERELGRTMRKHPSNMTAYDLTLQALDRLNRMDRVSLTQARKLLQEAMRHDPDYAPAYSHTASLIMKWIGQGWSEDETADRLQAQIAAKAAIDRDRNDAMGLAVYGHLQSFLLKSYDIAMDYLERALVANPSCAWAWGYSSLTSGYLGNYPEAIERGEKAVRLSPLGPDAFYLEHYLSQAYYLANRYEEAIGWGRMSAAHSPANASNLRCLAAGLVAQGEIEEARIVADRLLNLVPDFSLKVFAGRTPLRGEVRDLFIQRLSAAGLPD